MALPTHGTARCCGVVEADEPAFDVVVADHDPRLLFLFGGLDVATVGTLREHLGRALDGIDPGTDVVVDVAGLDFIDSTGLGAFVAAARRLQREGGGHLVLRSPRKAFRFTLEVAGLQKVFVVQD